MVFEEITDIKYRKYTSDVETVERHITLTTEVAEELNKLIAVVNKGNKAVKLNSTILLNLAMKSYLNELNKLDSEEVIVFLRKEALSEVIT